MKYIFGIICCLGILLGGQNTLTMAVSQNVGTLNPQGYNNALFAQNMLYEGLVKISKSGELIPSLATHWDISDNGKRYVFYLRKGVKFSNGEIFNADAVVLNFESILKNKARHSWCGLIHALDSVHKLDDFKIEIILKYSYTPTLNELSLIRPFRFLAPSAFPPDLDLVKHNPKPIGTGAYKLIESKLGVSDTFEKNALYWDKERYSGIYFDTIVLKVIFDPNTKLSALKSGQIDLIYGYDQIPIEMFLQIAKDTKLRTYLSPPIFSTSLVLNSSRISPILREAVRLGINKKTLIQSVYGDLQHCTDALFITQDSQICGDFDPARAKELLKTLEHIPPLELLYSGDNPSQKMMAEVLAFELKKIGIVLKLSASEPSIYHNRQLKGNFDISFNDTWGVPYEPLSMLYSMLSPSHIDFSAQAGLQSRAKIHALIKQVMQIPAQQNDKLLNEILSLLQSSNVYIPLTMQRNKAIAISAIKGIDMGVASFEIPFWEMYK